MDRAERVEELLVASVDGVLEDHGDWDEEDDEAKREAYSRLWEAYLQLFNELGGKK